MAENAPPVAILLVLERDDDPRGVVESVLAQSRPDLELIVADGSPSGVASALGPDPRLRLTVAPGATHGELLARAAAATGAELVGLVTPADRLAPAAVEKLATALAAAPDAVLVHAWFQQGEFDGGTRLVAPVEFDPVYAVRLHEFPIGPAVLFRCAAQTAVGGFDPELGAAAADDLWLRLAAAGELVVLPEPLAERGWVPPLEPRERERWGRERVALVDKVYRADPVAEEIAAVADQAYRNAFVIAAKLAAEGFNGPEERFYVADRLAPAARDPEQLDGRLMERLATAAQLDNELAWRSATVNYLRVGIAEREAKIRDLRHPPPKPVQLARKLMPPALRPAARRVADRVRPGSDRG